MLTHSSFRLTDLSHRPSQQPIPSSTVHCHPRPPLLTHHVIHSSATHSSISTDACCRASSGAACHWLRDWSSNFSVSDQSPTYSAPSLNFRPLLVDVISTTPSRRQPFPIVRKLAPTPPIGGSGHLLPLRGGGLRLTSRGTLSQASARPAVAVLLSRHVSDPNRQRTSAQGGEPLPDTCTALPPHCWVYLDHRPQPDFPFRD